jgi:tetratricopeptide (TPR) repeat protein
MMEYRLPHGESDSPVFKGLGMFAASMAPAGSDRVLEILNRGVASGLDQTAFLAARGYVYLAFGEVDEALADFESLEKAEPLAALFGMGQAREIGAEWSAAIDCYSRCLNHPEAKSGFRDLVLGSDLPPREGAGSWADLCLFRMAQCALEADESEQAEKYLLRLLDEGDMEIQALEVLVTFYQVQAVEAGERGSHEMEGFLRKFLLYLERLHDHIPNQEDIDAGLEVAELLRDASIRKHWLEKQRAFGNVSE